MDLDGQSLPEYLNRTNGIKWPMPPKSPIYNSDNIPAFTFKPKLPINGFMFFS